MSKYQGSDMVFWSGYWMRLEDIRDIICYGSVMYSDPESMTYDELVDIISNHGEDSLTPQPVTSDFSILQIKKDPPK